MVALVMTGLQVRQAMMLFMAVMIMTPFMVMMQCHCQKALLMAMTRFMQVKAKINCMAMAVTTRYLPVMMTMTKTCFMAVMVKISYMAAQDTTNYMAAKIMTGYMQGTMALKWMAARITTHI